MGFIGFIVVIGFVVFNCLTPPNRNEEAPASEAQRQVRMRLVGAGTPDFLLEVVLRCFKGGFLGHLRGM